MDIQFARNTGCFMNEPQRPPRLANLGFAPLTVEWTILLLLCSLIPLRRKLAVVTLPVENMKADFSRALNQCSLLGSEDGVELTSKNPS